jgi:hypothetical protein
MEASTQISKETLEEQAVCDGVGLPKDIPPKGKYVKP